MKEREKLKKICEFFNVEYHYEENPSQEVIFNKYQKKSTSRWMICIDEDEYIYLPNNKTVNEFLGGYDNETKLSLHMVNHFSNKLIQKKPDAVFLDQYNYVVRDSTVGSEISANETSNFNAVMYKTFIKNTLYHYILNGPVCTIFYIERDETGQNIFRRSDNYKVKRINELGLVHNPFTLYNNNVVKSMCLTTERYVETCYDYNNTRLSYLNNPFIAHYKYRSEEEYLDKVKYNKFKDVTNVYYDQNYIYELFPTIFKDRVYIEENRLRNIYIKNIDEWTDTKRKIRSLI